MKRAEGSALWITRRQYCRGVLALGALTASGCAAGSQPATGVASAPSAREQTAGREAAQDVERTMGLVRDPKVVGYVRDVGKRLTAGPSTNAVSWTFDVVDQDEPNAFALPGGYVYVSRSLLSLLNSEDELAGVMGHEVGHVVAHHATRRETAATPFAVLFGVPAAVLGIVSPGLGGVVAGAGKLAGGIVLSPYSRDQEREADRLGMELAAGAGWDPSGLSTALRTLARAGQLSGQDPEESSFFSTHPAMAERVGDTARAAEALPRGSGAPIANTRAAFLGRLDGVVVGPNPANGIFADRRFLHPDLGFAWDVPEGWKTRNTPEAAGASQGKGRAVVLLQAVAEGKDPLAGPRAEQIPEDVQRRLERVQISGLPALRTVADSRDARLDLTWIALGAQVYRIAGVSRTGEFEQFRPLFTASARSFRPLADADRQKIGVARLRAQAARQGETLGAVLRRASGVWNPEQAAIANGIDVDSRLEPGWLVKIPVRERYAGRAA